MKYEFIKDKLNTNSWRVEGIDYENEGVGYIAIFSGPGAEERAREYAEWMNKKLGKRDIAA